MFYATTDFFDKHQYNALFNKKVPQTVYDENGNSLGSGYCMKYCINNKLAQDIKVASEDSGAEIFQNLYKNDRDFYNFVTDKDRMESYFVSEKYRFKGYREAKDVLDRMKDKNYTPTGDDLQTVYRMFNYVIPYDGSGNDTQGEKDIYTQRTKFFNACKKAGYGAVLDTNDAIYGGFKAKSPMIVFDMENVISDKTYRTKTSEQKFSDLVLVGRKMLGL
ncbi:MAG: hypothetical protein LUF89_02165 [Ruminococcus sp.]|nr:hypothetical protein [Ruminococcus sp.]